MAIPRDKLIKYGVVFGVVALFAVTDLWSKRWAESNLANDRHLIPVAADAGVEGRTIGDVIRDRFPEMTDGELADVIFRVNREIRLDPSDAVFVLEKAKTPDVRGFYVFDNGDLTAFARRIERYDQFAIERWVAKARPDLGLQEIRKRVADHLGKTTLAEYLARKMPHLSPADLSRTISDGVFLYGHDQGKVSPTETAKPGELYLVGFRQVELIPGHLDFSYVENPAGAWGVLGGVDEDVRRLAFFVLSIIAILVVGYLLVRPPAMRIVPLVALGGILGGAIGNLVDRLTLAYVVDFIHMYWGSSHWPRYNVADIGITVGVIVLVLTTGFKKSPPKTAEGVPVPEAEKKRTRKAS